MGFYDGITGLVTQPIRGAEKEGAAGLMKGIAKGIGGLILKPGAGKSSFSFNCTHTLTIEYSYLGSPRLYLYGYSQRGSKDVRLKCNELHYCSKDDTRL